MGLSKEQLVEKCFIAAFPGQDQQQKQLYRYEVESWVDEALSQLGREVAMSQDYQLLQRTIVLSIAAVKDIPYSRFGSGVAGRQPSVDNGIITGENSAFCVSPERLTLSGSPGLVRSTFLEWQYITPEQSVVVGIIPPFSSDSEVLSTTHWPVQLRANGAQPSSGSVLVSGVSSGSVFSVIEGDIFRFEWDAGGSLTITQMDADRTIKTIYAVIGGSISNVVVPAVSMFPAVEEEAKVSNGKIGALSATTPADGLYRLDMATEYQFLTSFMDETGTVQFEGTTKKLSWVPNPSYRGIVDREDTWYWTFEGEQVVFWSGSEDTELPAESLRITASIIPTPSDLPFEYHDRAISLCIQKATDRALRLQTRRTQQVK